MLADHSPARTAPRGLAALIDALLYPLRAPAWVFCAVYLFGRIVAFLLPIYGALLQLVLTLGLYKYAFECLVSSARGRNTPPEVLASADGDTHRRHLLLQLWWLIVLVLITHFLELRAATLVVGALAVALPGALIALCVAQNLIAALNPVSWWTVAARLGSTYAFLGAATFGVLMLQVSGRLWLQGTQWPLLSLILYYALSQHLILSLFRAIGNALNAHASALQFDIEDEKLPVIQRDRELASQAQARREAREVTDPATRADALAAQLHDANDHALHQEYRDVLRQLGRRDDLLAHARRHVCELVALQQFRAALALANEALDDDPHFTLPEAEPLAALVGSGERAGLVRQMASLAANYSAAYPRRFDSLPLTLRAATLYADGLGERETARALLDRAAALATTGPEAAEIQRLQQRLAAGLPLRELIAAPSTASGR